MKDVGIIDPEGAANQSGLRDTNARLVLSLVRRQGAMPGAKIARRSGLSAQTVSNITRALVEDGLLVRDQAVKGKVGKPSVPVRLNPQGVHAFGLSIGRRSAELVLVDFLGTKLASTSTAYPYPTIEGVMSFLKKGLEDILKTHPNAKARLAGIGVAIPSKLWNWLEVVNAPKAAMTKWRDLDLKSEVTRTTGMETYLENDATSGCVAEHLLGRGAEFADFAYIFLGYFIGGGLVLNGRVIPGRTGNAASLGTMPVSDGKGGTTELLNVASFHVLESQLHQDGIDPTLLRRNPTDWSFCDAQVKSWIEATSRHLATATAAITSVVEVEAILIEGAMPAQVRQDLVRATQKAFRDIDLTLIERPQIEEAEVGRNARSLGAALLPIHSRYFLA
ncbi:MAG: ROK family transcriptional regulator [Pseudomonadota bacterium]